jgi:hypothetical protein
VTRPRVELAQNEHVDGVDPRNDTDGEEGGEDADARETHPRDPTVGTTMTLWSIHGSLRGPRGARPAEYAALDGGSLCEDDARVKA